MEKIKIRPYRPDRDEIFVYSIWRRTLGRAWPLSLDTFRKITVPPSGYMEGDHMVAFSGGTLAGFLATDAQLSKGRNEASISVVLVEPVYQRRGIGMKLVATAFGYLTGIGAERVCIGGGMGSHFWAGVPSDLPDAITFFNKTGWNFSGNSYDLVCSLEHTAGLKEQAPRTNEATIQIREARPEDKQKVLLLNQTQNERWQQYYRQLFEEGRTSEILLALEDDERLFASLALFKVQRGAFTLGATWRALLGEEFGGIAALHVAEHMRGKGAGSTLVAEALRRLKSAGIKTAYVAEVAETSLFTRLGFRVWREYLMASREAVAEGEGFPGK